ncbi:MAG: diguanylate cyclase [Betaproteobacteria bacterium]
MLPTPPIGAAADRLLALRHAFLDRLWGGMFLIALIGTPISVARAFSTGWHGVYTLHIVVALLAAGLFFARAHISYRAKLFIFIALFALIGASGVFTLGLMGSGVWFLVICSLLTSTFFSMRAGVMTAISVTLLLIVAAALFTTGVLRIPFDANVYAVSVTGWANLLIATAVMPFVVFTAVGEYQKTIFDLLHEVQQQRDHIAELAARDHLTGLPTANLANDRLQMKMQLALRNGTRVAVMFVDLNGFKAVNDTWGHEAGDLLLQEIAHRLRHCTREDDTVARIGGDEFVVLLGNLKNRQEAIPVAEKIIALVCQPVIYAGHSIASGASIGISIFPEDAADIATLRRLADRAMYQIKRTGTSGFAFADSNAPLSENRKDD